MAPMPGNIVILSEAKDLSKASASGSAVCFVIGVGSRVE
jgi:hypothetical protein